MNTEFAIPNDLIFWTFLCLGLLILTVGVWFSYKLSKATYFLSALLASLLVFYLAIQPETIFNLDLINLQLSTNERIQSLQVQSVDKDARIQEFEEAQRLFQAKMKLDQETFQKQISYLFEELQKKDEVKTTPVKKPADFEPKNNDSKPPSRTEAAATDPPEDTEASTDDTIANPVLTINWLKCIDKQNKKAPDEVTLHFEKNVAGTKEEIWSKTLFFEEEGQSIPLDKAFNISADTLNSEFVKYTLHLSIKFKALGSIKTYRFGFAHNIADKQKVPVVFGYNGMVSSKLYRLSYSLE